MLVTESYRLFSPIKSDFKPEDLKVSAFESTLDFVLIVMLVCPVILRWLSRMFKK